MIGPLILLVFLTFLNAVFASAEIAVISMSDHKIKKMTADGDKRARRLSDLTEQPSKFLATIQVAITFAGLLSSAFAADNFVEPISAALISAGLSMPVEVLHTIVLILITLVLAYFNLVFGELVPKRVALKKAEPMALGMSGMLYFVSKIFAPIVFLLTVSTNLVLRLLRIDPHATDDTVTEEEIRMLLAAGKEQGTIQSDETEMIQKVFEFNDVSAEQLCTHRVDVTALSMEDSWEEWNEIIRTTTHTRYPIYDSSPDDIIGVLNTKGFFRGHLDSKEEVLEHAVDKPFFIPETMKANILFQQMKINREYFAIVIDEYGGFTGLVTLHDLVEALVGDIEEEEDPTTLPEIDRTAENRWTIHGQAVLEDVADALDVGLPTDLYDTFGGFVFGALGYVPDDGTTVDLETNGLGIHVLEIHNRRVGATYVEKRVQ